MALQVRASTPLVADPAVPGYDKTKVDQLRLLVTLALGEFGRGAVVTLESAEQG